jgi:hypothetical protein
LYLTVLLLPFAQGLSKVKKSFLKKSHKSHKTVAQSSQEMGFDFYPVSPQDVLGIHLSDHLKEPARPALADLLEAECPGGVQ